MIERAGRVARPHFLVAAFYLFKCSRGLSLLDGRDSWWLPREYHSRSPDLISYQYMITKAMWLPTLIRALMPCFASTAKYFLSIHRVVTGSSLRSSGQRCRRRDLTACAIRLLFITRTVHDW